MRTCLTVILSFILFSSFGQVRPENGATLNYTQVLFKTQEVPNAVRYLFSVKNNKPGNQKDKSEITIWDSTHVAIINDLEFGRTYSWYVKSFDASGKLLTQSEESEFSIGNPLSVNPNIYRYIVTQNELSEDDQGVLFLDYNKVAINRNGKPVWFLPQGKGSDQNERIRDLKMTQNGTLTFLSKKKCLEISIDNEELWSTPTIDKTANDSIEYYHHEFTKLPSGNYLALGKYYESIELNSGGQFFNRLPVSMIVEYNKKGDTVWQWSTREYIKDTDLIEMDIYSLLGNTLGHCNSVYEDTKNSKLYISFRNLDGVIVLDKKSKKVISSYGENVQSDNSMNAKGLFSRQHAATPIESNKIVVFNNSTAGNSSSVVVFSEYNPSKKLWEFYCNFDNLRPAFSDRMGNVQVIDNGHYLVNMGYASRLFEVTPNKKVVWNCLPEKWNADSTKWDPFPNYRLNYQSSLYPKFFSLSRRNDEKRGNYFLLQNEGTDFDSYVVSFQDPSGNTIRKIEVELKSNEGFRIIPLEYLDRSHLNKNISIVVFSRTNSAQTIKRTLN